MSTTGKIGKFLATKIAASNDSTILNVVVEARSITPKNRAYLQTLCTAVINVETVTIASIKMLVLSATMTVGNIKALALEPWVEKISAAQTVSSRS